MKTTSTRPPAGTLAARAHETAHAMRAAVADGAPRHALAIARDMSLETARSVAAVLALSEHWPERDRQAMGQPPRPEPNYDSILAENAELRRRRTTTPISWEAA